MEELWIFSWSSNLPTSIQGLQQTSSGIYSILEGEEGKDYQLMITMLFGAIDRQIHRAFKKQGMVQLGDSFVQLPLSLGKPSQMKCIESLSAISWELAIVGTCITMRVNFSRKRVRPINLRDLDSCKSPDEKSVPGKESI